MTRLVYIVKLLSSNDVVYIMPNVAIWSVWEVTAGFLVLGIPAMPAAFKALPFSGSFVSLLRLKSRRSDQRGLSPVAHPQWQLYRPRQRRRRSLWAISDLESHDVSTVDRADTSDGLARRASEKPAAVRSDTLDDAQGLRMGHK